MAKAKGTGSSKTTGTKPPKEPHPITAPKIRRLAAIATKTPSKLTTKETQELGASVMRHIEPRGGKID